MFSDLAVLAAPALVAQLFPDRSLEETLAPLTTDSPVVPARCTIPTNNAQFHSQAQRVGSVPVFIPEDVRLLFHAHHVWTIYFRLYALFHASFCTLLASPISLSCFIADNNITLTTKSNTAKYFSLFGTILHHISQTKRFRTTLNHIYVDLSFSFIWECYSNKVHDLTPASCTALINFMTPRTTCYLPMMH